MKELISTNDVVLLSFAQDLLNQEGIEFAVLDQNMSLIEGSIGILPRRIMVLDEDFSEAHSLLSTSRDKAETSALEKPALQSQGHLDDAGLSDASGLKSNGQNKAGSQDADVGALSENEVLTGSDLSGPNSSDPDSSGRGLSDTGLSEVPLNEEDVTDDLFLGGALKIYQPRSGFRSGIDAVMLAACLPEQVTGKSYRVLEAGCGAGVVSLSIARRCLEAHVDAIEIEQINAAIAERNVHRNDLNQRVQIFLGDIYDPVSKLEILGLERNSYDFVVANPPFYHASEMRVSPHPLRRRAKRAGSETLEQWVRFMTAMAAPKGRLLMINRADKLDEILTVLNGRFGDLRVFPLFPKGGEPANRVLVSGKKGSKAPLKLLEGLTLHDAEGRYLKPIDEICSGPVELKGLFD